VGLYRDCHSDRPDFAGSLGYFSDEKHHHPEQYQTTNGGCLLPSAWLRSWKQRSKKIQIQFIVIDRQDELSNQRRKKGGSNGGFWRAAKGTIPSLFPLLTGTNTPSCGRANSFSRRTIATHSKA